MAMLFKATARGRPDVVFRRRSMAGLMVSLARIPAVDRDHVPKHAAELAHDGIDQLRFAEPWRPEHDHDTRRARWAL